MSDGGPEELVLPDGRVLAYDQHGVPDGPALFCFHGSPGSRLDFTPSAVMETDGTSILGRFVAVDRPGVGGSTPLPNRTLADWPADVEALADHLGIDRFGVLGYSGGGAYAVAVAAAPSLAARVAALTLVGAVAPPEGRTLDDGSGFAPRIGLSLVRRIPAELAGMGFSLANQALAVLPDLALVLGTADMCDADRRVLNGKDGRTNRVDTYREAARGGSAGVIRDVAIVASPWPIDLDAITAPTTLWAGADDNFVPLGQARHLAARLPHAHLEVVPHAGHAVLFSHSAEILRRALP